MRLFAAIKPSDRIIHTLKRLQKGVSGARWSDPDKFHITVGFFGDVSLDQAELLDAELAELRLPGFHVTLSGAGHFGRTEPRSLYMGVDMSESLERLHTHCRRSARRVGIDMERRLFRPHVTLAYFRPNPALERIIAFERNHAAFTAGPFLADQFFLYSSLPRAKGTNLYRVEASYPLLGP